MADFKKVLLHEFNVIGIEARTTNNDEQNPATAKIAGLWQNFFQENISEKIPHQSVPNFVYGCYGKYETDHNGPYSLLVGKAVSNLSEIPVGLAGVTLPSQKYAVFAAHGEMPQALIETWVKIWHYFGPESEEQRAYTVDFESHDLSDPKTVFVYIAIK